MSGLCDELITRTEESYRLWRFVACGHETSCYEEAIARAWLQSQKNKQRQTVPYLTETLVPNPLLHVAGTLVPNNLLYTS
jgi:hypothetical protein